jgi:hypothetical protein
MNEPPPLRNQVQAGSRRHGLWTRNGLKPCSSTSNCNNVLTGAKLADAAFSFF